MNVCNIINEGKWQTKGKKRNFDSMCLSERLKKCLIKSVEKTNCIEAIKLLNILNSSNSNLKEDVSIMTLDSYKLTANTNVNISCGFIIYNVVDKLPFLEECNINLKEKNKTIYYLLCRRRDTIQYIVVILVKYTNPIKDNGNQLKKYIELMTKEEQQRLIEDWTFDDLWHDVWAGQNDITSITIPLKKFQKNIKIIKEHAQYCIDNEIYSKEPEWGFIKGKKEFEDKSELECAYREFEEETYCKRSVLEILENVNPIIEEYEGSDGKQYASIYFVARSKRLFELPQRTIDNNKIRKKAISHEIQEIKWVTREKASEMLIPRKIRAILKAEYLIKQKENV